MTGEDARLDLRALLDAVEAVAPVDAVKALAGQLASMIDAEDVSFLIADFSGNALIRFLSTRRATTTGDGAGSAGAGLSTVPLEGSLHAVALRRQEVQVEQTMSGARLYAPVTDRGDAIGVLELSLASVPDEATVAFVASAAHALAYVVIANRRHTDLFERGQRNVPFSLAAEIQRRLLPAAFTCEAAEFTVAGWLEPASDVGGDTFDYSVERDALYLSISDALGHTVDSALVATLAVGSLRNSRRSEASVGEQAREASTAITQWAGEEAYVSALLLRVELASGVVSAVNAGHPLPYLVRAGAVTLLDLAADVPLGMLDESSYREQGFVLEPGDRLVLVTDGMLERNATSVDIAGALRDMTELHPREVVHTFARAVIGATGGDLQDDATVLCVDWYGREAGSRVARAGASSERASE